MSVFSELKRRGVFPVAAAYTVAAWLLVQVADVLLAAFDAPDWFLRTGIILLAVGFPVALILAWVFEWTSEGVIRSEDLPADYAGASTINKTLNIFIISVLTAVVILFALERFVWQDGGSDSLFSRQASSKSVAVLPFANRSAREEDLFFTEGIHDDLLTRLAKIVSLQVTSRTSVMRYRDTEKTIPEIGAELGVSGILEGGVQRSGDQVRINVQLIDAENDIHLWAETYDRELTAVNLFAIQSDIARAIASALQAALTADEEQLVDMIPTTNLAAYDAYLQGRQSMNRYSEESFRQALDSFQLSAELDPAFAGAYAGECEVQLVWYRYNGDTNRFQSAKAACERALSIDEEMAEVRYALGALLRYEGDYARASEEVQLALAAQPDNIEAHIELGMILELQGRFDEAEAILIRATELDPANWKSFNVLSQFYLHHGDSPQSKQLAVKHAIRVIELVPENASAFNNLGTAYNGLQQYEAAKTAWDRALELEPTRTGYTNRGLAYFYDGHFEDSAEMQSKAVELAPSDHRSWGRLAESYRFVEGRSTESREAYETAIGLAVPMLEINPQDWKTRGLLAIYLVQVDQEDAAIAQIDEALVISQRNSETLLYAALVRNKMGDTEGAIDALEEALEKDSSYLKYIAMDPDLRALQENQRFQQLLSSVH